MYEELIVQLRRESMCVFCKYGNECTYAKGYCQLDRDAADAIETLSRDFATIDDKNHDKDIEITELKSELERLRKSLSGRYRFLENERLRNELEREKEMHQHTSEVAWAYEEEIKRLKQERDAAVADMRQQLCLVCKKLKTCTPSREDIDDGGCSAFEWRGVAKEDAE